MGFGKLYRGYKWTVAGLTSATGATGLLYGVVAGATMSTIIGSLMLAAGAVIAIDNYRVHNDIDRFLDGIEAQRIQMNALTERYATENQRLSENVLAGDEQLRRMKAQNDERHGQLQRSEQDIKQLQDIVEKTRANMGALETIKRELEQRYVTAEAALEQRRAQIETLALEKEDLRLQLSSLTAQTEEMREQIQKLRELHENSKQLIRNLVLAGDMFTHFEESFGDSSAQLSTTSADLQVTVKVLQEMVAKLYDSMPATRQVRALRSIPPPPGGGGDSSSPEDR